MRAQAYWKRRAELAEMMKDKVFATFNEFRREYWKSMAKSKYAAEFGEANFANMRKGIAPDSSPSQWLGARKSFELHHRTPIHDGGAVYRKFLFIRSRLS